MKSITNWRKATVADFEADGFLDEATMLHVNSFDMWDGKKGSIDGDNHERLLKFFNYHIENNIPIVYHNGICFDVPLAEKILGVDLSKLMLIDTLPLSWYLNTERKQHGLDSFFDDYGIKKPKVTIDEWIKPIKGIETDVVRVGKGKDAMEVVRYKYIGLPYAYHRDYGVDITKVDLSEVANLESDCNYLKRVEAHKQLMTHRCEMDVGINRALWNDFIGRLDDMYTVAKSAIDSGLVDGTRMSQSEVCHIDQYKGVGTVDDHIDRLLTFLMFKMDCARLQEKTRWKADVDHLTKTEAKLSEIISEAEDALESVMPRVPKYAARKKPAKPYLKDDVTLSASGERWNNLIEKLGLRDKDGNELAIYDPDKPEQIKELTGYNPPNAGSSDQIKEWLFGHGWKPQTFKYVKDKEAQQAWADSGFKKELKPEPRKVPQVSVDGDDGKELCQSVIDLADDVPEVMHYNKYTTIKSRLDNIRGMLRDVSTDGYLKARIGGFTNCITADSVIVTSRGSLLVGDVKVGDKVLTHTGVYKNVTDTIYNGIKDVFRVKLTDGREIRCTYNHKFWDGEKWIMAKDLFKGCTVKIYGSVEAWMEIVGSTGYKISSWGRIMNPNGTIKNIDHIGGRGTYSTEIVWEDGVRRNSTISRLVLKHFVGESDLHALHKDGNPYNNNLANLYYGTDADNRKDTKLHGVHLKSVRNSPRNKISHSDISDIKRMSSEGATGRDLASKFGVSESLISMILSGKRWSQELNEHSMYVESFDTGAVESVLLTSNEPTFDISVEDDHSYIANGFVVHNTLRVQHRELVNLPSVDKPYGEDIRGSLTCLDGEILLGSDLSSLEDRVKHHFMLPHDPEYVKTMMADDYDPHLLTAYSAGLMSEKEFNDFKKGIKSDNAKAARKGGKTTNYCLPDDITEVLTQEGWKKFSEISVGDMVMSMDVVNGDGMFTRVTHKHWFEGQDVVSVSHAGVNLEATGNHRWVVDKRKCVGGVRSISREFSTTDNLTKGCNLVLSAPYVGGSYSDVNKVKLLSWMLSDGYFKKTNTQHRFEVSQSSLKFLDEVEGIFKESGYEYSKRLNHNSENVYIFTLRSADARGLMRDLGIDVDNKHRFDYTKFILSLNRECLKAFYDAFLKADGLTSDRYKKLKYNSDVIYQNEGNVRDAIQLCAELLGYSVKSTPRKGCENFHTLHVRKSGTVGLQKARYEAKRNTDVFCLTTETGTFMARQNGRMFMTGNCSVYGGSPTAIALASGLSLQEAKVLHKGYWDLNWAVKAISDELYSFTCRKGKMWLVNPVNGFCYSLRTEKDKFSTLCQGTGSYFFDMWVDSVLGMMFSRFNVKRLSGSFHKMLWLLTVM